MKKEIVKQKTCSKCGTITRYPVFEVYCDICGKQISEKAFRRHGGYDIAVHTKSGERAKSFVFCSLKCTRKWLLTPPIKLLVYCTAILKFSQEHPRTARTIISFFLGEKDERLFSLDMEVKKTSARPNMWNYKRSRRNQTFLQP